MAFTPRLTEPSKSDKNWINTAWGGNNRCINISNGSVLPNCFSGDTEIITDRGTLPLSDLVGQDIMIPTIGGVWRKASVKIFGVQELWEVSLSNGHKYKCTSNHRWVIYDKSGNWNFIITEDLRYGMEIHMHFAFPELSTNVIDVKPLYESDYVYCPVEPETHTCTLGGGEITGQCTGYAWGRFMEILGSSPKLSTANAGLWYGHSDGYSRGKTPQLGAVLCYSVPGQAGHVAIVEQINSDGSILISESGYQWKRFNTRTLKPPKYYYGSNYNFQGFIYNPGGGGASGKVNEFIKEAESHKGEKGTWVFSYMPYGGTGNPYNWGPGFVLACAKKVGILGKVIPKCFACGSFISMGVSSGMGTKISAGATPNPGDIVLLNGSKRIGIVRDVKGSTVYVVEGDYGSGSGPSQTKVAYTSYSRTSSYISAYFRPNWAKVNASSAGMLYGSLYQEENTREDALVRQVGYLNTSYKPSISATGIELSVMNYTTLLNALYQFGASLTGGSGVTQDINVDNISNKGQAVITFFKAKGLPASAGAGIAGNLQQESGINPALGVGASAGIWEAYGIASWTQGRAAAMRKHAGPNWKTNLTGQLEFMWLEMTRDYSSMVARMKALPNTAAAVNEATEDFCWTFERPSKQWARMDKRKQYAQNFWKQSVSIVK